MASHIGRRKFLATLGGAAAAWPLAARAQQPAMPVIGFLDPRPPGTMEDYLRAFRQGLKDTGYVEGENVAIVYRFAEGQFDRLPGLAAEVVRRPVSVIIASATASASAANAAQQGLELAEAARTVGRPIILLNASTDAELDAALAALVQQRVVAVLVVGDPFFDTRRDHIIAFAAQQKLPALYQFREYAMDGGLMSYGVSFPEAYREVGIYAARILNGAKPADLPVMQSVKFELVINLQTARALGLQIPDKLLALADEVIE
jgi:ABC-type uncharacterized transport system substrate-binding protein